MTLLIKTPTTSFSYDARNLVIEQGGKKIVIERADIPEALAAIEYVAIAEEVSLDETAECRKQIAQRTD